MMRGYRPMGVVYVSSIGNFFSYRVVGYGKKQVTLYGSHELGNRRVSRWQFDKWIRDRKLRHGESFYSCNAYYTWLRLQLAGSKASNELRDVYRVELDRIEYTVTHH